eukprot:19000-Heterococcus_DN1.PRE.2
MTASVQDHILPVIGKVVPFIQLYDTDHVFDGVVHQTLQQQPNPSTVLVQQVDRAVYIVRLQSGSCYTHEPVALIVACCSARRITLQSCTLQRAVQ